MEDTTSEQKKLSLPSNVSHTREYCFEIKEAIWKILDKNPLEKPKTICAILGLPYTPYRNYVTVERSRWHKSKNLGYAQKAEKHRVRVVSDCVPRSCDRGTALTVGWILSKNRNRELVWKDPLGRIEWFQNNKALAWIRKPATWQRGAMLVARAFFQTGIINDDKIFSEFWKSFRWHSEHAVYQTPDRLPYRRITDYVQTHGIEVVIGDLTHPHGVEIKATDASARFEQLSQKLLDSFTKTMEKNSQALQADSVAIEQFTEIIKEFGQPKSRPNNDRSVV